MALHDYVLDNQNGANFRNDINKALAAIVSNNSSATEPTVTYPFMWWADTANNLLKHRNAADTAWHSVKALDDDTFDIDIEILANRSNQANDDFGINLL